MKKILVIGIGSLVMTDDGIGTRIAEALKSKLLDYGVQVLAGETDFQYCFDKIRPDDFLIIIDAVVRENEIGSIEVIPLREVLYERSNFNTQHDFSLFDAILLNYPDIAGYLIGIEAPEIRFGFGFSEPLKLKFNSICEDVFYTILKMREEAEGA